MSDERDRLAEFDERLKRIERNLGAHDFEPTSRDHLPSCPRCREALVTVAGRSYEEAAELSRERGTIVAGPFARLLCDPATHALCPQWYCYVRPKPTPE